MKKERLKKRLAKAERAHSDLMQVRVAYERSYREECLRHTETSRKLRLAERRLETIERNVISLLDMDGLQHVREEIERRRQQAKIRQ